jgi:murein DD-endopeptidase MepM/ murein hydrolase activator NlpD
MKEQKQPDNGKPKQYVRNIVQASVALIILTAALWIGWWPDLAAVPDETGSAADANEKQTSMLLTEERKPDQAQQETAIEQEPVFSRGSQLLIGENQVTTSASSEARSGDAEQAATTAASDIAVTSSTTAQPQQTSVKSLETTATSQVQAADTAAEPFFGIEPGIFVKWQFPLKIEPHTPRQGVFGAGRTSTRLHAGIDLYAPDGTEVFAMTGGKVSQIYLFYESLLAIEVENDDGTTIRYTELTPLVKVGNRVEQGQLIARLKKNSGGSCMLHLEIYATAGTGPLTQVNNKTYLYVPMRTKSYMRRSDLVDPSAVYQLPRP